MVLRWNVHRIAHSADSHIRSFLGTRFLSDEVNAEPAPVPTSTGHAGLQIQQD